MLAMVKHPFVINPNPELKEIAVASGGRCTSRNRNRRAAEPYTLLNCECVAY